MTRRCATLGALGLLVVVAIGCGPTNKGDPDAAVCVPGGEACDAGEVCRYGVCVPTPTPCASDADCAGDFYCDESTSECLPWGVGPGGFNDPTCVRDPVPGVFFPHAQCEWLGPPSGDPYPEHKNVLGSPMVGLFEAEDEFLRPWIVFISYNYTDGGSQSCVGSDPAYYGVIRILDGRTCNQLATLPDPSVVASTSVAIGNLGGDPTPEIVAARTQGGLVAWTLTPTGWQVMWQTASTYGDELCNWGGPSIHDLDDDAVPEVIFYGAVYDNMGNALDESIAPTTLDPIGVGYIPVVADVDADGVPELVSGGQTYAWDRVTRRWVNDMIVGGQPGRTAVADLGTFGADPTQDNRGALDGIAEIVTVNAGVIHARALTGREIFTAPLDGAPPGNGGPPTIADFDGDGRAELAAAGATAYTVFDLDCAGTPDPATCPSGRSDGILWSRPSQDGSSNVTGSSVFDFEGDGPAEVVYGDECFTRVYEGKTGQVLYSRYRTSCTWYENPLVVDADGDFNAEIISTSNTNCGITCPAIDPIFDGVQCLDESDCPAATTCVREQAADVNGRCRCGQDADCGGDGFVCRDPIAGPSPAGMVCRAEHPGPSTAFGVRVLADRVDRWVNTRTIWNQHAYSVTNVTESGAIPRTSSWTRNWTVPGLNNFRQNAPGDGQGATRIPDLTIKSVAATCAGADPTIDVEVCNRGTEPVADGLAIAVYASGPPAQLACVAHTPAILDPGQCVVASCAWPGGSGDITVTVDDDGTGAGQNLECKEGNNTASSTVQCP